MIKRWICLLILICAAVLSAACSGSSGIVQDASTVDTDYKVYCIDMAAPALRSVSENYDSQTAYELVGECLEALGRDPERRNYDPAIAEPLMVEQYEFDENARQANIYFNSAYYEMSKEKEVLVRAAVVMTLTQFNSLIDYVEFYVNNTPLTDSEGKAMIMMYSDFVDSTSADIKDLNEETLTIYFASTDGTQLASEDVQVHYRKSATIESVVMERLISGPLSDTLNRTCSADTKLNSISVSDGLCTVDLNGRFLEAVDNQRFDVRVYSVVDSLCALPGIERVQILINGAVYEETVDGISISEPLTMNEEIIAKPVDAPPAVQTETPQTS